MPGGKTKTYYENFSGSVTGYGGTTRNYLDSRDEVANKWRVGGYKPGKPTGGNQGGDSGRGVDKGDDERQGSKGRSGP